MSLDFSQLKSLNIDSIDLNILYVMLYKNLLESSINLDGSIYNGTGYKEGYRISSNGAEKTQTESVLTGFIPVKRGDTIRMKGVTWGTNISDGYCYIQFYNASGKVVGTANRHQMSSIISNVNGNVDKTASSIVVDDNGVTTFNIAFTNTDEINYFRISATGYGKDMIVTVNQDIVDYRIWAKQLYTNMVKKSTESDGKTIYNGGLGYKNGYRVRSGGTEAEAGWGACTGFIPVKGGDVVRLSGWDFSHSVNENAINVSNSNFANIGQFTMSHANYGIFTSGYEAYSYSSVVQEKPGVWKWVVPPAASGVSFIRVTGYKGDTGYGADMIVTINEEIT